MHKQVLVHHSFHCQQRFLHSLENKLPDFNFIPNQRDRTEKQNETYDDFVFIPHTSADSVLG